MTIVITTLFDRKSNWMINAGHRIKRGYATVTAFVAVTTVSIIYFERLHEMGLTGLLLFIISLLFFIVAIIFIRPKSGKEQDRKSTRLNSSHVAISHAVFCLKTKRTA